MNYLEFNKKMKKFRLFSIREIDKQFHNFDRRRLVEWQQKGYILKIKNGYYCFAQEKFDQNFRFLAATIIYKPAYISLESALSSYGFIPEGVFQTTLCTSLKTNRFETPIGNFAYRHLKPELFFGYGLEDYNNRSYPFAYPEKALLDYLYFHSEIKDVVDLENLRWNKLLIREKMDLNRLNNFATRANSNLLSERLNILKEYIDVRTA